MLNSKSIVGPFKTVIQLEIFLNACKAKGYKVGWNITSYIEEIVKRGEYLRIENLSIEGFCDESTYKYFIGNPDEYTWYTADSALLALTKKDWTPSPLEIVEVVSKDGTVYGERVYLFTKPDGTHICTWPGWEDRWADESGRIQVASYTYVRQIDRTKYERKVMMTNAEWDNFKINHPEYFKSES